MKEQKIRCFIRMICLGAAIVVMTSVSKATDDPVDIHTIKTDHIRQHSGIRRAKKRKQREAHLALLEQYTDKLQNIMLVNPVEREGNEFVYSQEDNKQLAQDLKDVSTVLHDNGFPLNEAHIAYKINELTENADFVRSYVAYAEELEHAYESKVSEVEQCNSIIDVQAQQIQLLEAEKELLGEKCQQRLDASSISAVQQEESLVDEAQVVSPEEQNAPVIQELLPQERQELPGEQELDVPIQVAEVEKEQEVAVQQEESLVDEAQVVSPEEQNAPVIQELLPQERQELPGEQELDVPVQVAEVEKEQEVAVQQEESLVDEAQMAHPEVQSAPKEQNAPVIQELLPQERQELPDVQELDVAGQAAGLEEMQMPSVQDQAARETEKDNALEADIARVGIIRQLFKAGVLPAHGGKHDTKADEFVSDDTLDTFEFMPIEFEQVQEFVEQEALVPWELPAGFSPQESVEVESETPVESVDQELVLTDTEHAQQEQSQTLEQEPSDVATGAMQELPVEVVEQELSTAPSELPEELPAQDVGFKESDIAQESATNNATIYEQEQLSETLEEKPVTEPKVPISADTGKQEITPGAEPEPAELQEHEVMSPTVVTKPWLPFADEDIPGNQLSSIDSNTDMQPEDKRFEPYAAEEIPLDDTELNAYIEKLLASELGQQNGNDQEMDNE